MSKTAKTIRSFMLRGLGWLLLAGVVLYAAVCILCAGFQRRLLYFPPRLAPAQVAAAAQAAGLERWTNAAGQAIGIKRPSPTQPAVGRVLIVYGNGSWTGGCAHYVDEIQSRAPFDVFILEYPGYADRTGSPSQENIFRAADEALQQLDSNAPIYLVGESIGSGVAAYLAGTHPDRIAGLILLSPYNRMTDVAQEHYPFLPVRLLLADRFPSEDYLCHYHGPVGIMVDGRDTVVPEKFGLRLYDGYAGPKQLWRFPAGYHIAIVEPPSKFWGEVIGFWRTAQRNPNGRPQ